MVERKKYKCDIQTTRTTSFECIRSKWRCVNIMHGATICERVGVAIGPRDLAVVEATLDSSVYPSIIELTKN